MLLEARYILYRIKASEGTAAIERDIEEALTSDAGDPHGKGTFERKSRIPAPSHLQVSKWRRRKKEKPRARENGSNIPSRSIS